MEEERMREIREDYGYGVEALALFGHGVSTYNVSVDGEVKWSKTLSLTEPESKRQQAAIQQDRWAQEWVRRKQLEG